MGKETAATKETAAKLQPTESESQPAAGRRWNNIIPALTWLRAYQPQWLRADLIAGITLAAYLMPAGLADASLANVPLKQGSMRVSFPDLFSGCFVARDTQLLRSHQLSRCWSEHRSAIWLEATLHDFGRWPHAQR